MVLLQICHHFVRQLPNFDPRAGRAAALQFAARHPVKRIVLVAPFDTLRRAAQALCQAPLSATALRGVPEDQIAMASGLFNLHRNLAGAVGVALTATMLLRAPAKPCWM